MRDTDSLSLCRTCREDLAHLWETWETGHVRETTDHGGVVLATHNHSNLSSQSCPICAILKDHIREIVDNAQRSGKRIDLSDLKWTITTTKSPLARFIIVFRFSSSQFDWLHLNCYLDAGRQTRSSWKHHRISESTDSIHAQKLLAGWVETCVTSHERCNRRNQDDIQWRPKRLIDLGAGKDPFLRPKLSICKGENWTASTCNRYMTLSHHWSDTEPVKLLKSNLQAFQISIPFNTLLLKYQDAMKIAKQLGVRWLWIDCLCIVQDSVKDWYQESACMELVYSNSFCNITAGLANAEDSGCFFSRNPLQWEPFHIVNPLKAPPHIFRVTRLHHSPPIFKRGWVFQERLLCPRNVIFDKELLWECRETTVSELCPTPVNVKHTADIVLDFKNKVAPCPEQRWVDLGFHHSWTQMVTYYTMSNLTVPTDKLVALSGVAFAMSRLSPGDQYLAGIWRSQLPQGLLWQGPLWNTRPQEYLGPTWSWASSEGAVSFGEANSLENPHLDDVWAKVVKVGTVPFSEKSTSRRREFGRLKGGHVVLDAPIAIVNLTSPPFPVLQLREVVAQEQSWDLLALSKHNWVRWEGPVDSQILRPVLSVSLSGRGSRSTSSSMAEFVSTGIGPGSLCCVPLLHRPFTVDRAPFLPDDGVHGLLLFYHGQGFFTRAGCFNIAGDDKIIALFKNLPKKRVLIL